MNIGRARFWLLRNNRASGPDVPTTPCMIPPTKPTGRLEATATRSEIENLGSMIFYARYATRNSPNPVSNASCETLLSIRVPTNIPGTDATDINIAICAGRMLAR